MFINTSKILFESKSQHRVKAICSKSWCLSIRQRYFLKANHNTVTCHPLLYRMFINTSKILFESKSQLWGGLDNNSHRCLSIRQRYFLKANHNTLSSIVSSVDDVYQYVKDTFWKQITTQRSSCLQWTWMFINTSKILFESKSQPVVSSPFFFAGCLSIRQRYFLKANHNRLLDTLLSERDVYQYVKDTFWKQITTIN